MFKKKFYFIVFEGIEGTGKSFQIKRLIDNLKKKNIKVLKTREPGGSISAEKIRNLIFDKNSNQFDSVTDFYLMLAARNEHIKNTILPAKKNKKIIISDRFTDSTYAYQVIGNRINKTINEINQKYILNNIKPNLTILLKANLKSVSARLKKRKNKNKFDKLKYKFYAKAQNAFINLAKKKPSSYAIFDSSKNDNILEAKLLKLILKKIK